MQFSYCTFWTSGCRGIDASSGFPLIYDLNGSARVSGILGAEASYRRVGAIMFPGGGGWADRAPKFVRWGAMDVFHRFRGLLRSFIGHMQKHISTRFQSNCTLTCRQLTIRNYIIPHSICGKRSFDVYTSTHKGTITKVAVCIKQGQTANGQLAMSHPASACPVTTR